VIAEDLLAGLVGPPFAVASEDFKFVFRQHRQDRDTPKNNDALSLIHEGPEGLESCESVFTVGLILLAPLSCCEARYPPSRPNI
jgi:hypothetical protein